MMREKNGDLSSLFSKRDKKKETKKCPKFDAANQMEAKKLLNQKVQRSRDRKEEARIQEREELSGLIKKLFSKDKVEEDDEWRDPDEKEFVPDMSNLLVKSLTSDEEAAKEAARSSEAGPSGRSSSKSPPKGSDAVAGSSDTPTQKGGVASGSGRHSNSPLNFLDKTCKRANYKPKRIEFRRAEVDLDGHPDYSLAEEDPKGKLDYWDDVPKSGEGSSAAGNGAAAGSGAAGNGGAGNGGAGSGDDESGATGSVASGSRGSRSGASGSRGRASRSGPSGSRGPATESLPSGSYASGSRGRATESLPSASYASGSRGRASRFGPSGSRGRATESLPSGSYASGSGGRATESRASGSGTSRNRGGRGGKYLPPYKRALTEGVKTPDPAKLSSEDFPPLPGTEEPSSSDEA